MCYQTWFILYLCDNVWLAAAWQQTCYLISACVFLFCALLCVSAASSGGGSASVSQGAAGGPAEGPAAGAEGGGAGGEEHHHCGGERAAGQTHGGKCLSAECRK